MNMLWLVGALVAAVFMYLVVLVFTIWANAR